MLSCLLLLPVWVCFEMERSGRKELDQHSLMIRGLAIKLHTHCFQIFAEVCLHRHAHNYLDGCGYFIPSADDGTLVGRKHLSNGPATRGILDQP